uniref:Uncharacterized protein n=1 Tax=Anguilla anguilla TaxID=7936 RepID=A0A0E9RVI9_ANGAN
MKPALSSSRWS